MENADLVGTDLTLDIHENVFYDLESSKNPSKILKNLVNDREFWFSSRLKVTSVKLLPKNTHYHKVFVRYSIVLQKKHLKLKPL